ncbi:hypothetical protein MML48_4g00020681 [Holotrichia oblita]|uniref:Uncharacterized protein n=1 Tax=Holotrichia oblita TaxID=644536 RepID=A0ACB9T6K4_HOLOL|nr:hypothetical protein MML48_4g00020681 [Holotrichia oblita]
MLSQIAFHCRAFLGAKRPASPKETPRPASTSPVTRRQKNGNGEGPNVGKPCNLTAVKENTSIHSDDYKDALDDKTETENVDSLMDSTQLSITIKESLASKSSNSALCGGESCRSDVSELTTEFLNNIKLEMSAIPQTCLDLGSYLIKQRGEVVKYLADLKDKDDSVNAEEFIQDTGRLNQMINETVVRQTGRIERVMSDIHGLFEKDNLAVANQIIHDLERKLKLHQQEIIELGNELALKEEELKELRSKKEDSVQKLAEENASLKERLKSLESELQSKKKKLSDHGVSSKTYEQKIETLAKQCQESEKAKKDAETKANEVTSHFRTLQNKVKFMEQKWRDEKEELMKSHKGEHAILEKLTAERQALDTRWLITISLRILHELVLPNFVTGPSDEQHPRRAEEELRVGTGEGAQGSDGGQGADRHSGGREADLGGQTQQFASRGSYAIVAATASRRRD